MYSGQEVIIHRLCLYFYRFSLQSEIIPAASLEKLQGNGGGRDRNRWSERYQIRITFSPPREERDYSENPEQIRRSITGLMAVRESCSVLCGAPVLAMESWKEPTEIAMPSELGAVSVEPPWIA